MSDAAHTGISGGIEEALSPPGNRQENPGRNELSTLCSGAPRAEHLAKAQLDTKPGQQGRDVLDAAAPRLLEAAGCRQGQSRRILSKKCSQTLEATVCCKVARCQPGSASSNGAASLIWQRKS